MEEILGTAEVNAFGTNSMEVLEDNLKGLTLADLQTFAVKEVGKKMFSVSIMNMIKKQDHKRKKEKYQEYLCLRNRIKLNKFCSKALLNRYLINFHIKFINGYVSF